MAIIVVPIIVENRQQKQKLSILDIIYIEPVCIIMCNFIPKVAKNCNIGMSIIANSVKKLPIMAGIVELNIALQYGPLKLPKWKYWYVNMVPIIDRIVSKNANNGRNC